MALRAARAMAVSRSQGNRVSSHPQHRRRSWIRRRHLPVQPLRSHSERDPAARSASRLSPSSSLDIDLRARLRRHRESSRSSDFLSMPSVEAPSLAGLVVANLAVRIALNPAGEAVRINSRRSPLRRCDRFQLVDREPTAALARCQTSPSAAQEPQGRGSWRSREKQRTSTSASPSQRELTQRRWYYRRFCTSWSRR